MGIIRIEEVCFGVTEIDACRRFCTDIGVEEASDDAAGAVFRTRTHQIIRLVPYDDPSLTPGVEAAPSIREIVWGVESDDDLDRIATELGRDREVKSPRPGTIRSHDETGFAIAFRHADPAAFPTERRPFNTFGRTERWSASLAPRGQATPIRLIHVALDLPKLGREAAIDFYIRRLKFKPVEVIVQTGAFLQCEGETDHHQLFLCHRTDRPGINHIAMEVGDFDEVVEGGNYLIGCGWKEARRLGRHTVGSNLFRFFHAPWGGRFEYATDMDKIEKSTPPRTWEVSPPHHLWMMKTSSDA